MFHVVQIFGFFLCIIYENIALLPLNTTGF